MTAKRSKKKYTGGVNDSFANLVASTANKRMEAVMEQKIQGYYQLVLQKVSKLVLEHLANIQTRHLALEELLVDSGSVTREDINFRITEQEDKALGYSSVEEAKAQDLVRIEVQSPGEETVEKLRINSLMREVEGQVQTLRELESALVGAKQGEEKEILLKAEKEGDEDSTLKVKVIKISRKKGAEKDGTETQSAE